METTVQMFTQNQFKLNRLRLKRIVDEIVEIKNREIKV